MNTAREAFVTTDRDEALLRLSALYNARHLSATQGDRFGVSMTQTQLAGIALVKAEWTGSFTLEVGPVGTHLISATATGGYHITCRPRSAGHTTAPGTVHLIADPDEPLTVRLRDRALVCAVDVRPEVLRRHAEALLGTDLRGIWRPLDLAPTGPAAATLGALIISASGDSDRPGALVTHHLLRPLLAESLLTALLLATDHPWREHLDRPAPRPRSRSIQQAADALQADPAHPWTVAELAALVGLSARALQQGFRSQYLTTPTAYLRRVRLAQAHRDLCAAEPGLSTVEVVARRWGFRHLPRFAGYYHRQYGVHPHTTLQARREDPAGTD
ncbi:AraC family transcriptional regulator [Kitasatospora sp. MMS16-BH015]|uniref:helix-turn-helix transcriptional regulator n=1 Tax=Kitasatospora sp. MMS16-BH015 TaxID=2018025 RepID=UPI000CA182F4|nr:helix-turn-helix transcriptional regulator [Kitasatospora sp. MMS16-BH015]AUG75863.1 AraC family transcriptional regulator [Kitasatospora sp. MMS16-BH015]